MADWNPDAYARFRDLRLRPALDLMDRVPDLPAGAIVDLGCGDGVVGPELARRWPGLQLLGIDASPAMLAKAAERGIYARLEEADAGDWSPDQPPALIFSNAALHWLPDHGALLPRFAGFLAPGGSLAVQMPRQYGAPSHRFLRDFAADMFPGRFDLSGWQAPVAPPVEYARTLSPLGEVNVWETDYVQRLAPSKDGHPVRRFTESTAMRPFFEKMEESEAREFLARYEAALASAYPAEADGSVLFPFRRLFLIVTR
ncbi:methyltransferase domain-containing protein [Frigidibacter sp. SD6-1]|uniref:methyltransferase domain-containing protein n=1 Tax=Frigidibacter sp. SD6-1 TaxID=3032581 RepID=UPI0024DF3516|nr:methyltransferase domain-containing protein [Frigidibacter sp. SD6-1]